jgi:hypothetical protein
VLSRTSDLLACAFPNGALALAPHFSLVEESWSGGFFRDPEKDSQVLENLCLPDDHLILDGLRLVGQVICYQGRHCVSWRCKDGRLQAFAGLDCTWITLDGQEYRWADSPVDIAWHPLKPEQAINGFLPLYRVWCNTPGPVHIPLGLSSTPGLGVWLGAPLATRRRKREAPAYAGLPVGYVFRQFPFELAGGDLRLTIDDDTCGHWLYVCQTHSWMGTAPDSSIG